MRIGIFGGTFDPPHLGHMRAAEAALELLSLDRLVFVPAGLPPHKTRAAGGAPGERRYDMVRLMADGMQRDEGVVTVSRLELDRGGPSYTADTLDALRILYPDGELILLTGADMFLSLHDWHAPERVFAAASVVGFSRGRGEDGALSEQAARLAETFGARASVLTLPQPLEVSSTELRGALAAGGGADLLWPPVYGYLLRHGLYGVARDLTALSDDDLRCVVLSMIQYKRAAHIRGTEGEAARLANRWGEDARDAARAGILHDCTKYFTLDEQLALCARHGIAVDELERGTEKLLHAKTAAALARDVFHERDAVAAAIATHTTGAPDMTVLQKILYVADYIEPTRDFPEAAHLRALAYENLDRAVGACLALSRKEIAEKGRILHRNTAEALAQARGFGYV